MSEGNDFALELVVGIKDLFTQKAKQIDAEVNKLEKDTTTLQKTCDDTSAYKKATQALEEMGKAGSASAEEIEAQEKVVDNLAKTLKKAGVDITNITREEQRFTRQMKETNAELKKRSGYKDMVSGGIKAVASASLLAAFTKLGGEREKIEQMMRKQSNFSRQQISGDDERAFRTRTVGTFNVSAGEVAGVQTYFNRANQLNGGANHTATTAALQLGNMLEGKADQDSINRALSPLIRSGMDPNEAASLIYTTFRKGGGEVTDLLDAVQEYYGNLHSRGLSGKQFFSALIAGTTKGGVYSYDKVADSLKETFAARLTDPGTVASILGHGKTAGAIEQITDRKLYGEFNAAMHQFQADQLQNKNTVGDVSTIYNLLGQIAKKNPAALQNLSTYVGGGMLAEDSGINAAAPIGAALTNPDASLGNYKSDFAFKPGELLTTVEKAEAAKKAGLEGLANAAGDATKQLDGFASGLQIVGVGVSNFMNAHPTLTHIGTDAALAGTAYLGVRRGWGVVKGARAMLAGGSMLAPEIEEGAATGLGRGGMRRLPGAGKFGGALNVAGNALTAYSGVTDAIADNQAGNRRAADEALGSTAGSILLGSIGSGIGSVLLPGVGTAAGLVAGGWLGGKIGGWLGDVGYDLFNSDDDKKSQDHMNRLAASLPDPDVMAASGTGGGILPEVSFNIVQNFTVNATTADPQEISKAMEGALREANPELIQQIEYSLAQLMQTNDHQRPSN